MIKNIEQGIDNLMLKTRKYNELTVALVVLVFFLCTRLFIGKFMNLTTIRWRFLSPAFWPGLILLGGTVLSAVLVYNTYKQIKTKPEPEKSGTTPSDPAKDPPPDKAIRPAEPQTVTILPVEEPATSRELIRLVSVLALTFVYLYLIRIIGFLTSTLIFCFAYLFLLKERHPLVLIISPLAIVVIILIIFTQVLVVPLPRGIGVFQSISNFFY